MKKGDIVLLSDVLKAKKTCSFKMVYKVGDELFFTHPKTKRDAKGTVAKIEEHYRHEDSESNEVCDWLTIEAKDGTHRVPYDSIAQTKYVKIV